MAKRASTKDKIPFYVFDKQIAYSPRKKGEKVVFKDSFRFNGSGKLVGLDMKKQLMTLELPTVYSGVQTLYAEGDEVVSILQRCLLNNGMMYGQWEVYRKGNKILLRYADSVDN